jgi:hypothetical protein
MPKIRFSIAISILFILIMNSICFAQDEQTQAVNSSTKKEFKNTISYNISNPLMFGFKTIVVGYERTIGKHHSFTVDVGQITLPTLSILPSSIKSNSETTEKGYKIAVDYRFYPAAENKYNAPRGVYFAPYFAYNYFDRKKSFTIDTSTTGIPIEVAVSTDFNLQITTVGAELGYQFVFWKRLAVDLILVGPGISGYNAKINLDTSLDPDNESELFTAINDALAEKIPGYSLVIKPGDFNKKGSTNTTTIGFRYLVHVGFRF